ncbi:hypothetical protein SAMN05660350_00983 [Geodermatophilus obscurus]|uniref:Uncharacterized protein n=1 Tax=Geodermatophilus obscurus TaxID=1861 RepID=A0A1M7SPQ8_9ACTN|nr:hypothetical protein [Geodermatophilus obscurus]SHN60513.1 hypothetical protein SAMN05660350_00983 [Geodermatophilus obscurus]
MRTYDPADHIVYVHLAQYPAAPAAPSPAHDECHRLPAGYANTFLDAGLGGPRAAGARPALVVLPGGSAPPDGPVPAAPALRLAR